MKLLAFIYNHIPEPVKVVFLAGTFFGLSEADIEFAIKSVGLSQADIEFAIKSVVGLVTIIYIATKTVRIWFKKKGETK